MYRAIFVFYLFLSIVFVVCSGVSNMSIYDIIAIYPCIDNACAFTFSNEAEISFGMGIV